MDILAKELDGQVVFSRPPMDLPSCAYVDWDCEWIHLNAVRDAIEDTTSIQPKHYQEWAAKAQRLLDLIRL